MTVAETKRKGDFGEAMVVADALRRGYKVARPLGEDWPYDLIVLRHGRLERVQCKYTESDAKVIVAKCRSTNNWVDKRYTSKEVDWLAVYDATTDRCYYVPSSNFSEGRTELYLRLKPTKNGQKKGVREAREYLCW